MSSAATDPPILQHRSTPDEPFDGKPPFEPWGRYPKYNATVVPLTWQTDYPGVIEQNEGMPAGALPVGMGRSYGDVCLLKGGHLLVTTGMNRLLHFEPETGLLTCEAGVTLAQILDFAVPRGFFLPVTPGTKYVTIAGAIANDIHGKNHHVAGTFGNHIAQFEIVRSDGTRIHCSPTNNPDWYSATIGGLGLTGLITWATLRLKPIVSRLVDYEGIQFHGIDEFLDLTNQSKDIEYTVSWIDCASNGRNFARGRDAYEVAQCNLCHRVGNAGGSVGPDLTAISSRYQRRDILSSIIEPSKVVSEQYMNTAFRLKNGDTVVGRVVEENNNRIIVQPDALKPDRVEVKLADLEVRKLSPLSPMPEGLVNVLSKDEILDLMAYLEAGGRRDHPDFSQ